MFRSVLLVGLLLIVLLKEGSGTYPERVLLRDIQVITLHQGEYANARRSSPIPQLQCVGGTAGCSAFTPKVVQCYNRGSDGYDVQWECKTEMEKAYRFGDLDVSCEGFDYADDPYVLKGSCGLEYKLDLTGVGNHQYEQQHGYQTKDSSKPRRSDGSSVVTFVLLGITCLVIYVVYKKLSPQQQTTDGRRQSSTSPPPPGFNVPPPPSGFNAPPPPGFRPEYMPGSGSGGGGCSSSYSGPNAHTYSPPHNTGAAPGGFWTGAATGGILGYLFGSRNNAGYQRQPNYSGFGSSGWGNSGVGSGWGGSAFQGSGTSSSSSRSSTSGSDTRTTSGFGGTKRR